LTEVRPGSVSASGRKSGPQNVPKLLQDIGAVTGVALLGQASWLLTVFILARHLPREEFGRFMLWVYAVNLLGSGALLGYPSALLRGWPRHRLGESRWPRILLPLSALCLGIGALVSAGFTLLYRVEPANAGFLFLAGVSIGFSLLPVTLLQIFRRYALGQALYSLWRPALLVLALGLFLLGRLSVISVAGCLAGLGILQAGLAVFFLRGIPRGTHPMPLRGMAVDAAAFAGLQLAAILAMRLDSFAMPRLLDLDALGLYSAMGVWSLTGYQIASLAVGQVLNPRLASSEHVPWGRLVATILGLGALASLALVLLGNRALPMLFGAKYGGDHRVVIGILAATGLLQTLYVLPSSRIGILASRPRLFSFLAVSVGSVAIGLSLLLVLVPRYGLTGAAGASALTWVLRAGTAWWVAGRGSVGIDGNVGLGRDGVDDLDARGKP
jgi:O-antigen/teichoic acid export membrane protein